jgi:hypothetical protein
MACQVIASEFHHLNSNHSYSVYFISQLEIYCRGYGLLDTEIGAKLFLMIFAYLNCVFAAQFLDLSLLSCPFLFYPLALLLVDTKRNSR